MHSGTATLSNNNISSIENGAFNNSTILTIDLENNPLLSVLKPEMFPLTYIVEEIYLENTGLTVVPYEVFESTSTGTLFQQYLLSNNRITAPSVFAFMQWYRTMPQGNIPSDVYLNDNQIEKLDTGLFNMVTINELSLDGNPISAVADGAFTNTTICNLYLPLVGSKAYSQEIIRSSFIDSMFMHLYQNSPYYDADRWQCFKTAPTLCASTIVFDDYCADILKQMKCSQKINLNINFKRSNKTFINLGIIESPGNFSHFGISTDYYPSTLCFDGTQIVTDEFNFDIGVCEATLLSISQKAKFIVLQDLSQYTGYAYIPPVFLKFQSLQILTIISSDINCTCGLAILFYSFTQHVNLTASCRGGEDVATWINENYDRCNSSSETVPEFDSVLCKQNCTFQVDTTVKSK